MTGYGRREIDEAGGRLVVETRSLNNRYLDVQVKAPRQLAFAEPRVKKAVQERFARGRFDISITRNGDGERTGRLVVNETLAEQYIAVLKNLKSRFGLSGDMDLALVAGLPDLITVNEVLGDREVVWNALSSGLARALDELERMRLEEGSSLARDITERLLTIEKMLQSIGVNAPTTVENARKRMEETLARILKEQPDPVRVAQEIAILAERTDITEELTRLGSHMTQFRSLLSGAGRDGIGRKLDFLIQEMGREVNTIASKAMDARISMDVVSIKAELEKIREQVQNIE
jgi:uncharacterized protein (TIGR00255 family)